MLNSTAQQKFESTPNNFSNDSHIFSSNSRQGNYQSPINLTECSKINSRLSVPDQFSLKYQYLPSDIKGVRSSAENYEKVNKKQNLRNHSQNQEFYSITEVEAHVNSKKFLYSGDKEIGFNIFSSGQLQPSFLANSNQSYIPAKEKLQKITKRYPKQIMESIFCLWKIIESFIGIIHKTKTKSDVIHQDSDLSLYDSTYRRDTNQDIFDHQNLQNNSGHLKYPLIQTNHSTEKNKFDYSKLINSKLIERKKSIKETNLADLISKKQSIIKNIKEIFNYKNNYSLNLSKTKQLYELVKTKLNKKPLNNRNSATPSDSEYPI